MPPLRGPHRQSNSTQSAPVSQFPASSTNSGTDDSNDEDDNTANSITNRCSPKRVHCVVSKFNEYKKELVRQAGFGGLLDMWCITKVNLKLSAWLLSKLDVDESCLVLSESQRIFVHEKDVGIVLGIPCRDLDLYGTEISQEQIDTIRFNIGLHGRDPRSFKALEQVLSKHLDDKATRQEEYYFKIAFVIYVMGYLLVPTSKHDHGNTDYWGCFQES
jgi:hypothetical protein